MRRLAAALLLLSLPLNAHAKDLRNRFGVGFQNQLPPLGALSLKYWLPTGSPAVNVAVEGVAAVSVDDNSADEMFFGGRLLYAFVTEDNMNLYGAAGAGFMTLGDLQNVRLQPALGVEFFFFGLENLGFVAEVATTLDLGEATKLFTVSGGPGIGVHYYF